MARMIMVLTCVLAALGGCSSNLRQVTARVDSVRVDEKTDEGVRVLVTVVAENPNDIPLPVVRAEYEVDMPDRETFSFTDLPGTTVPAKGKQVFTFPAAFARVESGNDADAYRVSGQLTYEPPGEIRKLLTDYSVPLPSAGFKSKGTLP